MNGLVSGTQVFEEDHEMEDGSFYTGQMETVKKDG